MRQFLFAAIALACGLAACSKPYDTPVIEGANGDTAVTFEGLLDLMQATPSSPVRVLWTHGMCRHDEDWSTNRARRLVAALGPGATSQASPPRPIGDPGAGNKRASLRREVFTAGNASAEVDFFFWAPLTDAYKDALIYDRLTTQQPPGQFKLQRASLNRDLKSGLLNDCLLDAVVYSGPNGHPIRKAMRQAVCEALGGTIGSAGCDVQPGRSTATLVFISESLGSKMLFDAVVSIWDEAQRRGGDAQLRVANALASTRMMFMVSNQVPLLDAAGAFVDEERPPSPPGVPPPAVAAAAAPARTISASAPAALGAFAQARAVAAARPAPPPAPPGVAPSPPPAPPTTGPLTLVAFSDPNDLLSYHLVPGQLGGNSSEFRFVNVAVSNDVTYFGWLERPDTAHCGYAWNASVLGLLIQGRHAGKPLPTAAALPAGACF